MPIEPRAGLAVLVVDDEPNIRKTLRIYMDSLGCKVTEAANRAQALQAMEDFRFDLALLDLKLGEESGIDLIPAMLERDRQLPIVVVTAYATIETAVTAVKAGAFDYLPKPFTAPQIEQVVKKAAERRRMQTRILDLEARLAEREPGLEVASASPAMRAVVDALERAAAHDVPILLRGENGTGKSMLARFVHAQSPRAHGPFVIVNCPTLSDELLASELFGHTRGSFTGAVRDTAGKVEIADGGTLFLDEIGELSPGLQAKLLRFLQDREYERVGDTRTRRVDVRLVFATNRDLARDLSAGRFREDLFHRINTVEVTVPSLRERREDILHLARRFVECLARSAHQPPLAFSSEVEHHLLRYPWPGNVRELKNALERAVIFAREGRLEVADLPERLVTTAPVGPWIGGDFSLEEVEAAHIAGVLDRHRVQEQAARVLGVNSITLWRRRKRQA